MDDVISRTAAMTIPVLPKEHRDYISFELDDIYEQGWNECQKIIAELPSADRPQGEWIDNGDRYYRCSLCGTRDTDTWDWCHGCGCRMKGADGKE